MVLSTAHANAKLEILAEYEGFANVDALLAGFRQSQGQIAADAARAIERARRNL